MILVKIMPLVAAFAVLIALLGSALWSEAAGRPPLKPFDETRLAVPVWSLKAQGCHVYEDLSANCWYGTVHVPW